MALKTQIFEAAADCTTRGWLVFPCQPRGKQPLTTHGVRDATLDSDLIAQWWSQWPLANLGVATGAASRLVVLDIDLKHDGPASLTALEEAHGELPETVEVLTGSGGRHIWFAHPGVPIANSAGKIAPGLDIRGDGGYIVAPPSQHESGRLYAWEILHHPGDTPLAPMPSWLLGVIRDAESKPRTVLSDEPILEGARNDTLFRLACAMRRYGAPEAAIRAALDITNQERCVPPLSASEVARIAASAAK